MTPIDIAAHDRRGNLVVVVEVKARPNASADWASRFRRNLLAHDALPDSRYFAIVTPEALYMWDSGSGTPDAPTILPTSEVVRPFAGTASLALHDEALTLATSSWLWDIARGGDSSMGEVRELGLAEALRDGTVRIAAAA